MFGDNRKLRYLKQSILAMFLGIVILITGCRPSYEERQAQKEAERKEQEQKKQEEEKRKIGEIEGRFNAIYFPPQNIVATSFTYEIQKFFEEHSDDTIVFQGYLEDIEATENNTFVEILCPIGENYFLTKMAIRFRLTVPESKVGQFLEAEITDPMLRSLRFIYGPDYFITSRIIKIQRVRKYEFDGTANGDEVEIETEVSRGIVAIGKLIEAIAIPKKE